MTRGEAPPPGAEEGVETCRASINPPPPLNRATPQEQGSHDPRDDAAGGAGGHRRRADHDVVALPPRLFKQLAEPRRMERLVGTRGAPAGLEHRKTRAGKLPHHVRQRQTLVRDRVRETSTGGAREPEHGTGAGPAKVGRDEETSPPRRPTN